MASESDSTSVSSLDSSSGKADSEPPNNPRADEPDITTDLVIDITQLSLKTPTINGTYDLGGNPGDYIPGKDFSETDDVATGTVVDYELGVSLTSISSTTYPIDKMYLEVVDPADPLNPDYTKVYYLNTNPDPQDIIDDGSNTLVAGYSMKTTGLVFGPGSGITSTSTQKMPASITIPNTIFWKTKVMPQVRIVCERNGQVKKSDPFTLETVRFSSASTLQSVLDTPINKWNAVAYEVTPQGTGFLLPFDMSTSRLVPTTFAPLGTPAQYDTITFSANIGAKLDNVAQTLTVDSFQFDVIPALFYTFVSKTYENGILTVVVKPTVDAALFSFPALTVSGKVFVPYTKGAAQQVTVAITGSWNAAFGKGGVQLNNFVNEYLFSQTATGAIDRSKVISFVVNPIPVFVVENIQASYPPPDNILQSLRISPNTFTNNTDMKFVRLIDSKIASLPKATGMKISLYQGASYTFVLSQSIPPALYTFQYAYVPTGGAFDPNALSQQVLNGAVPLDTYENVIANTGNKPNIMLATLSGDATQGLPITDQITQQYEIQSPAVIPVPGSEFYTIYSADPAANYTTYVHSYIALATNYLNTTLANAAYGGAIASIDQFVQRGSTVYLDLGTNKAPAGATVTRFSMLSTVRADLPVPNYNAIMISGLFSGLNTPVADVSDYTKEYNYKVYRRTQTPAGQGNAQFKAGTVVTVPVSPAVAPYLYLGSAPYLHVFNQATLSWTDVPVTTYSYNGSEIKLTMPVDYVMNADSPLVIPVRFILPFANIPTSTNTPTFSTPLYLATFNQNSVVETFPNNTPYFKTTFENTAYRLLGGNVDTTGLVVSPHEYLGGTAVTYTANVSNISFPTNDYYVSMTVPTNQYNPKETSDNTNNGFITDIVLYNPTTTLYYQTAAAATAQDIAQMKSLNGATNLQQFYDTRVVTGWTKYVPGVALPADVVMMVAYAPNVLNGTIARVDYKVKMDVAPDAETIYNNNSVITYYSEQANLESQSNEVTIFNRAKGTVNVNYVEKGTNMPVAPPTQLQDWVGTPYSTTPKTVAGYTLDSDSGNTTGVFEATPQTVTYYYVKIPPEQGAVIVKYLEKNTNNPLAPQDTITGDVGSPYTTTPKVIAGYTLDSNSGNTTGTFQTAQQTVIYYYVKNPPAQGTVLVKYLEKTTNLPLAAEDTLTGDVGTPYGTTPKNIPGYMLDSDSGNTTGVFQATQQTVTYYYVKIPPAQGTVVVKYLEKGTNTPLAPETTLTGDVGTPYGTTPKAIPGYAPDSDSGNTTGFFLPTQQTVTYYYTKCPPQQGVVIVNYVEKGTNLPLVTSDSLTGAVGSPYTTTPKTIPGYSLDSNSGNTSGTFQAAPQTVTYYYVKIPPEQGTVIVKYLEKGTNITLAPSDTLTGAVGTPYGTTPKAIQGYTLDSDSGNTIGVFKAASQTVTYYYVKNKPEQGTVIVNYLEKGTNLPLAPSDALVGAVGTPYATSPKTIAGYNVDSNSGNTTGVFKLNPQTVIYYYVKACPGLGTVNIQYLEKGTNAPLAPQTSTAGVIGSPYTTTPKLIQGYTLDSDSGNTSGMYQAAPQTVTYYYVKKAPPVQSTVLVKYLEKDTGKVLAPQDTLTGNVGEPYATSPKTINGYNLHSNSGNTSGTFQAAQQTVTYYYVKCPPIPITGDVIAIIALALLAVSLIVAAIVCLLKKRSHSCGDDDDCHGGHGGCNPRQ